ncbi:MAG TPA: CPBP family intramembrane glutamic endopeptidase [Chondromyces sp.]|nr:CPBP family intramembrane glutamic endopeptidase [Chondromyces sp.]
MKKPGQAELISQMTDREIIKALYLTQFVLLTISLILGIFLYGDFSTFFQLFQWEPSSILVYGLGSGLVIVLADVVLMKILPEKYYDDGGINERLFANQPIWHIAVFTAFIAITEELLFRGIIQTFMGFLAASIIFALIHFRYLSHWYLTLNVLVLSFWIGAVFEWTNNLAVTIIMHFIIDFLLGIVIHYKKEFELDKRGKSR